MINFRFHIVSLTAVLLSLGIGLVLGTTFLDDATVEGLRNQLDGLESDLDAAEARNGELESQLNTYDDEAGMLDDQLGERLFTGQLGGEPVLVVSTRGVDGSWVERVTRSLQQADGDVVGVWWLTDRLDLDDESEVSDLAAALELTTDEPDRLERNLVGQLADVLFGAAEPVTEAGTSEDGQPAGQPGPGDAADAARGEPALLERLREGGFVEYDIPDGVDTDVVELPGAGVRIVVVDGPDASVPVRQVLVPMLRELTADGPMPVVATQPTVLSTDEADDETQPQLVAAIRDDDDLTERVSGVDSLDRVSGQAATVLAAVDAAPGRPVIGQYGSGDGAERLMPPADDGS
jgi:hypothetical protein